MALARVMELEHGANRKTVWRGLSKVAMIEVAFPADHDRAVAQAKSITRARREAIERRVAAASDDPDPDVGGEDDDDAPGGAPPASRIRHTTSTGSAGRL